MLRKILGIILILNSLYSYSTHIAGADLTYKCLGGNDYLITFTFYRDCSGIEAPESVVINFSSSCYDSFEITLFPLDSTGVEVTPTCNEVVSSCRNGNLYGLQQFVYKGQTILKPCVDWRISYYLCCRNYSHTIKQPESTGMYIPATLNNKDFEYNSSPEFSNIPVTVICAEQTFCFNHGAIDADGDSLVYSLVTPYDKGPDAFPIYVLYGSGYSAEQPLPSTPPVTINRFTGDICMTPDYNIISPMAVLVEEYRNGIKIGSVIRDMQVNVITCSNLLPVVSGISADSLSFNTTDTIHTDTVCFGKKITLYIHSYDPDNGKIWMKWNKGIPSADFSVYNNPPYLSARFNWQPDALALRNSAHCFTVTVGDDFCPYIGSQTFAFCIYVKGFNVSIGKDTVLCLGEQLLVNALTDTNVINYNWEIDGKAVDLPPKQNAININSSELGLGIHRLAVTVRDNNTGKGCPGYDFINISVIKKPVINLINPQYFCEGNYLMLDAGENTGRYLWNTGDTTRQIYVSNPSTYYITVDGAFGTRCIQFDTVEVKMLNMPKPVRLANDTCIMTKDKYLILDAGKYAAPFKYYWSTADTTQTININNSGIYSVIVASEEGIKHNCLVADTIKINMLPPVFLGADTTICNNKTLYIKGPSPPIGHKYIYNWLPDGENTKNLYFDKKENAVYSRILNIDKGCADTINIEVKTCDLKFTDIFAPANSKNNSFVIENIENYRNCRLIVFNRWGEKIFENSEYENPNNIWKADKTPAGVYFYLLYINNKLEKKGTVTVLK
ncbi:MAG: gliding motility-associated C-terminal domain-containing protein [Bacteroidales bacterium]|nr:gliding motility-associated C-terminal domain-containing protein [Bacteroidales bacterium]